MSPTMSVFTIVHRALPPLSLWKRRTSLKGKSPCTEIEISEKNNLPEPNDNGLMHHDVHTVEVAVRGDADEKKTPSQPSPPPEDLPEPECRASSSETLPTRVQFARAVSWASIVRSQDRWTAEQEKELVHAQRQLEKCQKAWSSEQEVWLVYVQALSEEKEAHTGFLSARHRQQGDEQHQFRKAWKRRRSSGDEEAQQSDTETANRLGKLRRLQRYSYSGQQLGAGPTALSVKA
ncbi:unnamed protein product [Penicillium salamii]|nr:unnamed protein product [Penicillium salamii]CAG8386309.1 unnamed protein product [Penicillium salamii]